MLQIALTSNKANAITIDAFTGMQKPPRRSQPRRGHLLHAKVIRDPCLNRRPTVQLLLEVRVLPENLRHPVKVQLNQKAEGDAGKAKLR